MTAMCYFLNVFNTLLRNNTEKNYRGWGDLSELVDSLILFYFLFFFWFSDFSDEETGLRDLDELSCS